MKRKLPWIDKDARRRMETLRKDLERQVARAQANGNHERQLELEQHIRTISRELSYDEELKK